MCYWHFKSLKLRTSFELENYEWYENITVLYLCVQRNEGSVNDVFVTS